MSTALPGGQLCLAPGSWSTWMGALPGCSLKWACVRPITLCLGSVMQVKHVRHNLQIIIHNPKHSFKVDPNGFVIPVKQTEEEAAAAAKAAKAAEAAALNSNHGSLFDHLLKNVLGEQAAGTAAQQQPPSSSSLVDQMNQLHNQQEEQTKDLNRPWSNGNGNGKALQQQQQQQQPACTASMLSADAQAEKQAFLSRHGKDYGYGGMLDQLYPCEVRAHSQQCTRLADVPPCITILVCVAVGGRGWIALCVACFTVDSVCHSACLPPLSEREPELQKEIVEQPHNVGACCCRLAAV